MKELGELLIPGDLRYAASHEWVRSEGQTVRVGITDYAQDQLGDVVFVDLAGPGTECVAGEPFGTVESVKAVSDLIAPVSGTVMEMNSVLEDQPQLVNEAPYGEGWLVRVQVAPGASPAALLDADGYRASLAAGG